MPGPRIKFRGRPKKLGAKKRTRTKAQKKRLLDAGLDKGYVGKLTEKGAREALKKVRKKKLPVKK